MRVDADVATRIRTDTKATIRTLGLLGDKYIELVPGRDPNADAIPAGGHIPTADPMDYEQLVGQSGGDIVSNVVEVTASLKDVLGSIQRGEGLLGAMVKNREFGDRTLESLQSTITNLNHTTKSLDGVVQRVDRGEGVLGKLTKDQKLATSLEKSVNSARTRGAPDRDRARRGDAAHRRPGLRRSPAREARPCRERPGRGRGEAEPWRRNGRKAHQRERALRRLAARSSARSGARGVVSVYRGLRGLWPSSGDAATPPATEKAR